MKCFGSMCHMCNHQGVRRGAVSVFGQRLRDPGIQYHVPMLLMLTVEVSESDSIAILRTWPHNIGYCLHEGMLTYQLRTLRGLEVCVFVLFILCVALKRISVEDL